MNISPKAANEKPPATKSANIPRKIFAALCSLKHSKAVIIPLQVKII